MNWILGFVCSRICSRCTGTWTLADSKEPRKTETEVSLWPQKTVKKHKSKANNYRQKFWGESRDFLRLMKGSATRRSKETANSGCVGFRGFLLQFVGLKRKGHLLWRWEEAVAVRVIPMDTCELMVPLAPRSCKAGPWLLQSHSAEQSSCPGQALVALLVCAHCWKPCQRALKWPSDWH